MAIFLLYLRMKSLAILWVGIYTYTYIILIAMYEKERRRVVDHCWRNSSKNEVSIIGWKGGARIVSQGHR